LMNWIGIAGAGGIYHFGRVILVDTLNLPHSTLFGFAAALLLPVALFYRPPDADRTVCMPRMNARYDDSTLGRS
jgi:hypothetical protein